MFDYRDFRTLGRKWQSYEGDFSHNAYHGIGTLILTNGEKYIGKFLENKVHKAGNYKKANGELIAGIWIKN